MDTVKIKSKKTLMIAHRGVSGLETENTLAAFVAAGNRSYFGIETDVHVTRDGKFAIFHDDKTGRVAEVDLPVEKSDYALLAAFRLYDRGTTTPRCDLCIPQLADYIRTCKRYDKVAVLELKNRMETEQIGQIIDVIRKEEYLAKTIFISFSWENLEDVRSFEPGQTVQFLTGSCDDALIEKLASSKFDLDLERNAATKELVKALHKRGIRLNCWTVDNPAEAKKLVGWGVDFITSNILE